MIRYAAPLNVRWRSSGSNTAAINHYNQTHKTTIVIRHSKYLNNVVEQDHRAVKRRTRPMLGFRSFWSARCTIAGIETMHAIHTGQLAPTGNAGHTPAEQFYALAA
jgi:transposase-like protein